jgi:ATP-dependent DNA ligase
MVPLFTAVTELAPSSTISGTRGEGFTAEDMAKCRWLKPLLVAQIEFAQWIPANHLRHPRFVGLREDKRAIEVDRENSRRPYKR